MFYRIEYLLKFVEIPFIYSFLIIPLTSGFELYVYKNGESHLNPDIYSLILVLGIIGSILTITDPYGKFCKLILSIQRYKKEINYAKNHEKDNDSDHFDEKFIIKIRDNYCKHGRNTLPINTEINKIVGYCYFFTLILSLLLLIPASSYVEISESFVSLNLISFQDKTYFQTLESFKTLSEPVEIKTLDEIENDEIRLLVTEVKHKIHLLFFSSLILVVIIIYFAMSSLIRKNRTVSIYLYAISHQEFFENDDKAIEYMQKSMREGRWELAEEFTHHYYRISIKNKREDPNLDDTW